jgi:gas vesicle structural protein
MTAVQQRQGGYLERPAPSSLADVVAMILDKGLVIDAYVRVSLVGIELLTIDARIVIASVDTYLRFAEATNRLDLYEHGGKDLGELAQSVTEGGAKGKTSGAIDGAKEKVGQLLHGSDDDDGGSSSNGSSARRRPRTRQTASRRRSRDEDEDE